MPPPAPDPAATAPHARPSLDKGVSRWASSFALRAAERNMTWPQYLWHHTFHHCCHFERPPHLQDQDPVPVGLFLRVIAAKLLLEVCGAAGAVWGFCEIINWRQEDNAEAFRYVSAMTGFVFAVRFYWHAKHFWQHGYDFPYVKRHHRRTHLMHGSQVFGAKFLLQVCGAAGAVWGASEALTLRDETNSDAWQVAAWITAVLFGSRWMMELFSYCLLCTRAEENSVRKKFMYHILPWVEVLGTKFILEVCGAAGAVWGCADITTLRGRSLEAWRIVALSVGALFMCRWISQVKDYAHKREETPLVTEPPRLARNRTSDEEDEDSEEEENNNLDCNRNKVMARGTSTIDENDEEQGIESDLQLVETYGSTSS